MPSINASCRTKLKLGYVLILFMLFYFSFWIMRCVNIRNISCEELWSVIKASDYMTYEMAGWGHMPITCLTLDSIPEIFPDLLILSEDRRFYSHRGVDVFRSLTAVKTNLGEGRKILGASTLTQQMVKILWGSHKRTLLWKIHESAGAIILDALLTKEKILELYFNCAIWIHGYIGIDNAVYHEFQKKVSDLTPYEMLALVSSLPAPLIPGESGVNRRYYNRYRRLKEEAVKTGLLKDS